MSEMHQYREWSRAVLNLKIILMLFTIIFVAGGALHLSSSHKKHYSSDESEREHYPALPDDGGEDSG